MAHITIRPVKIKWMDTTFYIQLSGNEINEKTLRAAAFLPGDAEISLSYGWSDFPMFCRFSDDGERLVLPTNWEFTPFTLHSNKTSWHSAITANLGAPHPKKRKSEPEDQGLNVNAELAEKVKPYALYFQGNDNLKRSVIPLTKTLAATFYHRHNQSIQIGETITIRSYMVEEYEVQAQVRAIHEDLDTIVLQSTQGLLSDKDMGYNYVEPRKGAFYLCMGYSIFDEKTNHLSLSTGIIASNISRDFLYTGTSGSYKGDSGGSCWDGNGRLMGMQKSVAKVPHTTDGKEGSTSPASGGECYIIPIRDILRRVEPLREKEPDEDEDVSDEE